MFLINISGRLHRRIIFDALSKYNSHCKSALVALVGIIAIDIGSSTLRLKRQSNAIYFPSIFKNSWKTQLGVHFFSSLQNPISTLKWRKYNQSQFKLSKIVTSHLKNAFQNKSNFWLITLKNLSNPLHFRGLPVKKNVQL